MANILSRTAKIIKSEDFIQLIKYGMIGIVGLIVDFGSYYILTTYLKLMPEISNIMSSSLGIINNFMWNSYANFKVHDHLVIRFIRYFLVGQITTVLTTLSLFVFVTVLHQNQLVVKVIATIIATLIQFIINKVFTFKKVKK